MATKAYGSITIVDIGDLGQLSIIPESNQPGMVIYDPDTDSYNPNWSVEANKLILSPVAYYGGTKLLDSSSTQIPTGATVTWKQIIGNTETALDTGSGGKLIVTTNPFSPDGTKLITYKVIITYTEPNMGTTLEASGQISFGLVQNANKVKSVVITGESAFLYNSSGVSINPSIVLTATTKNVNIEGWYYKNTNGNFTKITSAGTSAQFTIRQDDTYFNNDIALIRIKTNDSNVYDDHSIIKIRDGANGDSLDAAVLSNEDQMVPCDQNGIPIVDAFTNCKTTLTIYEGNSPTYEGWSIVCDTAHGVTGNWDSTTHVFTATSIDTETGYVTFTCSKTGHNTLVKTFSLVKVKAGADGVSPTLYSLESSSLVSNKDVNNVFTPSTITLNAFSQTGDNAKSAYNGRLKYFINGSSSGTAMTGGDKSSWTYTITDSSIKQIKFVLYAAGGTTTELDSLTVAITADGATGEQGVGGLSFVLGNYSDVIPCTNGGLVANQTSVIIPFTAFKGTNRVACTATYSTLPSGISLISNTAGTSSASGELRFSISKNASLSGATILTGTIIITITAEGTTGTQTYTWTKNNKALDGDNAIVFQIFAPAGNVISNDGNNVTLDTLLTDGPTTVTSGVSYQWYKYVNGTYSTLSGKTSKSIVISPSDIDSYGSFKCQAAYNSKTYDAYFSVYDKTDPLQITVLSTLGDKIINSVGQGILYANVFRNGEKQTKLKPLNAELPCRLLQFLETIFGY